MLHQEGRAEARQNTDHKGQQHHAHNGKGRGGSAAVGGADYRDHREENDDADHIVNGSKGDQCFIRRTKNMPRTLQRGFVRQLNRPMVTIIGRFLCYVLARQRPGLPCVKGAVSEVD